MSEALTLAAAADHYQDCFQNEVVEHDHTRKLLEQEREAHGRTRDQLHSFSRQLDAAKAVILDELAEGAGAAATLATDAKFLGAEIKRLKEEVEAWKMLAPIQTSFDEKQAENTKAFLAGADISTQGYA